MRFFIPNESKMTGLPVSFGYFRRKAKNGKYYLVLVTILILAAGANAQSSLDSLMARVSYNNPSIAGARQYYDNMRIASKTNRFPENPELEYAYLWGSPENLGNRTDFSISQSFEFPGVYTNRGKISRSGVEKASSMVNKVRQETILESRQLWIEKVFLNRKRSVLETRLSMAEQLDNFLRIQLDNGEISRLKYNKVVLLLSSLRSEFDQLKAESSALDTEITRIAGGIPTAVEDTMYFFQDQTVLDSVLQASNSDPLYQAHLQEVELKQLQVKLARSSSWPKFKTGYYSEQVVGTKFAGLRLGMTIPLWENVNKVKTANGAVISAEMAADKHRADEIAGINQVYARYKSYLTQQENLSSSLRLSNDPAIIARAMEAGEISVLEYFYETDLYYSVLKELIRVEKELLLAEAELNKYNL